MACENEQKLVTYYRTLYEGERMQRQALGQRLSAIQDAMQLLIAVGLGISDDHTYMAMENLNKVAGKDIG